MTNGLRHLVDALGPVWSLHIPVSNDYVVPIATITNSHLPQVDHVNLTKDYQARAMDIDTINP